ncbi:winged helix-turn-helix transcriptional regulator [Sphingomonas bacterium]|uniref:winged helix-turn-helix transcriptional regulator n=1 Tax=Sphingomonas bacterium TaxID=1895847 RepID=UPI00266F880A|nr:helix-turn-helix domain-containing protein [Sphingomonas bacterium]
MIGDPRGPFAATCPTRHLLDQVADKWSMLALIAIAVAPRRFNALKREIEGISQKVLTQTLRRLERNGLISRTVEPTVPVSVTYAITPLGRSLATMMEEVRIWSVANIGDVLAAQSGYDQRASVATTS